MVQAQGIMLRDNVRTIGHMIRLYTNKNSTLNGTGKSQQHIFIITLIRLIFELNSIAKAQDTVPRFALCSA